MAAVLLPIPVDMPQNQRMTPLSTITTPSGTTKGASTTNVEISYSSPSCSQHAAKSEVAAPTIAIPPGTTDDASATNAAISKSTTPTISTYSSTNEDARATNLASSDGARATTLSNRHRFSAHS